MKKDILRLINLQIFEILYLEKLHYDKVKNIILYTFNKGYVAKNKFFLMSELGLMLLFTLLIIGLLLMIKFILQIKSISGIISSDKLKIKEKENEKKKEWIAFKVFNQAFMGYDAL